MGCNCGGARREAARAAQTSREAQKTPPKPVANPNDPGYYWVGPQRPPTDRQA